MAGAVGGANVIDALDELHDRRPGGRIGQVKDPGGLNHLRRQYTVPIGVQAIGQGNDPTQNGRPGGKVGLGLVDGQLAPGGIVAERGREHIHQAPVVRGLGEDGVVS